MEQVITVVKETVTDQNFLIGVVATAGIFSVTRYLQGRRHRKNFSALVNQMEKDFQAAYASE